MNSLFSLERLLFRWNQEVQKRHRSHSQIITRACSSSSIHLYVRSHPPPKPPECIHILLADAGWSFNFFNEISFIAGVITSLVMLATIKKIGKTFHYNVIMATTQILTGLALLLQSSVLYADRFKKWEFSIFWCFLICLQSFSFNVFFVAVVGRMSKYLPEGFESFGVTTVVAVFNLAKYSLSQYFGFLYLNYYGVYGGYYSRMRTPQALACGIQIFFVVVSPLFLFKK